VVVLDYLFLFVFVFFVFFFCVCCVVSVLCAFFLYVFFCPNSFPTLLSLLEANRRDKNRIWKKRFNFCSPPSNFRSGKFLGKIFFGFFFLHFFIRKFFVNRGSYGLRVDALSFVSVIL